MSLLELPVEIIQNIAERTNWSLNLRLSSKYIHSLYDTSNFYRYKATTKLFKPGFTFRRVECQDGNKLETEPINDVFHFTESPYRFSKMNPFTKGLVDVEEKEKLTRCEKYKIRKIEIPSPNSSFDAITGIELSGDLDIIHHASFVISGQVIDTIYEKIIKNMKRNNDGSITIFPLMFPILTFALEYHEHRVEVIYESDKSPKIPFNIKVKGCKVKFEEFGCTNKDEYVKITYYMLYNGIPWYKEDVIYPSLALYFEDDIIDKVEYIMLDNDHYNKELVIYIQELSGGNTFPYSFNSRNFIMLTNFYEKNIFIRLSGIKYKLKNTSTIHTMDEKCIFYFSGQYIVYYHGMSMNHSITECGHSKIIFD